jgi:hypothetical protein
MIAPVLARMSREVATTGRRTDRLPVPKDMLL